jgi:outer membrane receptor for Fe3+-dicitrate
MLIFCFIRRVAWDFEPEMNFLFWPDLSESLEKPPLKILSKTEYLYVESLPLNEFQSLTAQIGFTCFVHRTNELPSDASARFYQHFNFTQVKIYPHQTLLSDGVTRMGIDRRNCYFEHERSLELFQVYSKQNCEHECQSFAFARQCGCVPFYLLSEIQVESDFCRNSFKFISNFREIRREDLRCTKPKLH